MLALSLHLPLLPVTCSFCQPVNIYTLLASVWQKSLAIIYFNELRNRISDASPEIQLGKSDLIWENHFSLATHCRPNH